MPIGYLPDKYIEANDQPFVGGLSYYQDYDRTQPNVISSVHMSIAPKLGGAGIDLSQFISFQSNVVSYNVPQTVMANLAAPLEYDVEVKAILDNGTPSQTRWTIILKQGLVQ